MDVKQLDAARRFDAAKMVKTSLFATERLFYDLYCLEPGQAQKVHSHAGSDKVYLSLDGPATVTIASEERSLGPGEAVLAPAGVPHGVRAGTGRAVLLVVTTPPPIKS
jgi:quercetin dioxygenase-like cupin family protein